MDNVIHQNRELGDRLVELEKLWLAEEQFTMELCGRVEALQVCLFLRGVLVPCVEGVTLCHMIFHSVTWLFDVTFSLFQKVTWPAYMSHHNFLIRIYCLIMSSIPYLTYFLISPGAQDDRFGITIMNPFLKKITIALSANSRNYCSPIVKVDSDWPSNMFTVLLDWPLWDGDPSSPLSAIVNTTLKGLL